MLTDSDGNIDWDAIEKLDITKQVEKWLIYIQWYSDIRNPEDGSFIPFPNVPFPKWPLRTMNILRTVRDAYVDYLKTKRDSNGK